MVVINNDTPGKWGNVEIKNLCRLGRKKMTWETFSSHEDTCQVGNVALNFTLHNVFNGSGTKHWWWYFDKKMQVCYSFLFKQKI